jgi:alkyl hydroperoxide reductase subunit AhpF
MYEVAIIGGGPAATAAAVYAARKLLKTVLITESFGGQSVVSEEIQNWIGTPKISGNDLAKSFEAHRCSDFCALRDVGLDTARLDSVGPGMTRRGETRQG